MPEERKTKLQERMKKLENELQQTAEKLENELGQPGELGLLSQALQTEAEGVLNLISRLNALKKSIEGDSGDEVKKIDALERDMADLESLVIEAKKKLTSEVRTSEDLSEDFAPQSEIERSGQTGFDPTQLIIWKNLDPTARIMPGDLTSGYKDFSTRGQQSHIQVEGIETFSQQEQNLIGPQPLETETIFTEEELDSLLAVLVDPDLDDTLQELGPGPFSEILEFVPVEVQGLLNMGEDIQKELESNLDFDSAKNIYREQLSNLNMDSTLDVVVSYDRTQEEKGERGSVYLAQKALEELKEYIGTKIEEAFGEIEGRRGLPDLSRINYGNYERFKTEVQPYATYLIVNSNFIPKELIPRYKHIQEKIERLQQEFTEAENAKEAAEKINEFKQNIESRTEVPNNILALRKHVEACRDNRFLQDALGYELNDIDQFLDRLEQENKQERLSKWNKEEFIKGKIISLLEFCNNPSVKVNRFFSLSFDRDSGVNASYNLANYTDSESNPIIQQSDVTAVLEKLTTVGILKKEHGRYSLLERRDPEKLKTHYQQLAVQELRQYIFQNPGENTITSNVLADKLCITEGNILGYDITKYLTSQKLLQKIRGRDGEFTIKKQEIQNKLDQEFSKSSVTEIIAEKRDGITNAKSVKDIIDCFGDSLYRAEMQHIMKALITIEKTKDTTTDQHALRSLEYIPELHQRVKEIIQNESVVLRAENLEVLFNITRDLETGMSEDDLENNLINLPKEQIDQLVTKSGHKDTHLRAIPEIYGIRKTTSRLIDMLIEQKRSEREAKIQSAQDLLDVKKKLGKTNIGNIYNETGEIIVVKKMREIVDTLIDASESDELETVSPLRITALVKTLPEVYGIQEKVTELYMRKRIESVETIYDLQKEVDLQIDLELFSGNNTSWKNGVNITGENGFWDSIKSSLVNGEDIDFTYEDEDGITHKLVDGFATDHFGINNILERLAKELQADIKTKTTNINESNSLESLQETVSSFGDIEDLDFVSWSAEDIEKAFLCILEATSISMDTVWESTEEESLVLQEKIEVEKNLKDLPDMYNLREKAKELYFKKRLEVVKNFSELHGEFAYFDFVDSRLLEIEGTQDQGINKYTDTLTPFSNHVYQSVVDFNPKKAKEGETVFGRILNEEGNEALEGISEDFDLRKTTERCIPQQAIESARTMAQLHAIIHEIATMVDGDDTLSERFGLGQSSEEKEQWKEAEEGAQEIAKKLDDGIVMNTDHLFVEKLPDIFGIKDKAKDFIIEFVQNTADICIPLIQVSSSFDELRSFLKDEYGGGVFYSIERKKKTMKMFSLQPFMERMKKTEDRVKKGDVPTDAELEADFGKIPELKNKITEFIEEKAQDFNEHQQMVRIIGERKLVDIMTEVVDVFDSKHWSRKKLGAAREKAKNKIKTVFDTLSPDQKKRVIDEYCYGAEEIFDPFVKGWKENKAEAVYGALEEIFYANFILEAKKDKKIEKNRRLSVGSRGDSAGARSGVAWGAGIAFAGVCASWPVTGTIAGALVGAKVFYSAVRKAKGDKKKFTEEVNKHIRKKKEETIRTLKSAKAGRGVYSSARVAEALHIALNTHSPDFRKELVVHQLHSKDWNKGLDDESQQNIQLEHAIINLRRQNTELRESVDIEKLFWKHSEQLESEERYG